MTATTATPVDTQGMLLIHRVIRREFGALPALIRTAAGQPTRAKRLAAHLAEMLDFLKVHHEGEDELVWPLLRQRAGVDAALIDQMEAQHEQVCDAIAALRRDIPSWSAAADQATGERMAATIETMNGVLEPHLAEEEQQVLPLISATFSQAEWDALADHGFGAIPGKRRLVMLGHILEEADPAERAHMMEKVPAPARVAFKLIGHRQFAREATAIRQG